MQFNGDIWRHLPFEIWCTILSYLTPQDHANYSLVNKAWSSICTPHLYETLYLEDLTEEIVPIICHSSRQLGQWVKKIKVNEGSFYMEEMEQQLILLIDACPNVEYFEYEDEDLSFEWWKIFLKVIKEGHVWRKLKKLPETIRQTDNMDLYFLCALELRQSIACLQVLGPRSATVQKNDVQILESFPCLTTLCVFPRFGYATIQDYEVLLECTYRVKELVIDWHDLGLSQVELDRMESIQNHTYPIKIYPQMKKLTMGGCFAYDTIYTPQMRYFLQKFPCLQELSLTIHQSTLLDDISVQYLTRIPNMLIKVRCVNIILQLLPVIVQVSQPCRLQFEYLPEFRFLRKMTIQLVMTHTVWCHIDGEYEDDFDSSVTASVLHILGPKLHHLVIEHPCHFWSSFNLSTYGDCCPNIQTLQICSIEINRYLPEIFPAHLWLTELHLKRANLTDTVFADMSRFLPNLHTLILHECRFSNDSGALLQLKLDMPKTRFDNLLELDLIQLECKQLLLRLINNKNCLQYYIYQDNTLVHIPVFVVHELYANEYPHVTILSITCQSIHSLCLLLHRNEKKVKVFF